MKKLFILVIIASITVGVFFACSKQEEKISKVEAKELATDIDFQNFAILFNERKKGYAFLNPSNTQNDKQRYLLKFASLSANLDNGNTKEQLELIQLMGYKSLEDYGNGATIFLTSMNKVAEKYPTLKTMRKEELSAIFGEAIYMVRGKLNYKIYPNGYRVPSIYNIDDLIKQKNSKSTLSLNCFNPQNPYGSCNPCSFNGGMGENCTICDKMCGDGGEENIECCQRVMSTEQTCYYGADSEFFWDTFQCGLMCAVFLENPPFAYSCFFGCEALAANKYGAKLEVCTDQADSAASQCSPPCW